MPNDLPLTNAELGLVRVAAVSPEVRVADVAFNTQAICDSLDRCSDQGVALALFPELCITGYTCGDLFWQRQLLDDALDALHTIVDHVRESGLCAIVGLPLLVGGRVYNCAAFVSEWGVLGIVAKSWLPTYNEFYEQRWFTSGLRTEVNALPLRELAVDGHAVPFGVDLLFRAVNQPDCVVGIEICEDLWAVSPPSSAMALAGATLLLNPSASPEVLGKTEYRRELVRQQSARAFAAYLYAGAGPGESTTDLVYAGHSMITENGTLLCETERFQFETQLAIADIDLQRLNHERIRNSTYGDQPAGRSFRTIDFNLPHAGDSRMEAASDANGLRRPLARTPFVPVDAARRAAHCQEIFAIQATGLAKRIRHTNSKTVTIGLSGGLDSTLALLVIARSYDMLGLDRTGILAITMPGFGTTARTRGNAEKLAEHLGVTLRTIDITPAVRQHFADIGHDEHLYDVTYENAQARERTQILMDVANQTGGFVVGTGDLSEGALGWMTFNGDHMSMYHVNAGVPKTLVRYLVSWAADALFAGEATAVLHDIVDTPITPELLPLGADNKLEQKTEETIGPYELHDFFLFQVVRYQFAPRKVFWLAQRAFAGVYDDETILKWLRTFYRRFFSQQFKRSSMPDGPKVGSVALSPRGDWRMPSDASAASWLRAIEE